MNALRSVLAKPNRPARVRCHDEAPVFRDGHESAHFDLVRLQNRVAYVPYHAVITVLTEDVQRLDLVVRFVAALPVVKEQQEVLLGRWALDLVLDLLEFLDGDQLHLQLLVHCVLNLLGVWQIVERSLLLLLSLIQRYLRNGDVPV